MTNLFGEPLDSKPKKLVDKKRRNWENRFQRWSDRIMQDGTTAFGKCGEGYMCDYCDDNTYGRPCVRALNELLRDKRKTLDYSATSFEQAWRGEV